MKNEKVIFVNRSNDNKEATTNEKMKFAIVMACRALFVSNDEQETKDKFAELGIFGEKEISEALRHLEKHVEAIETKFAKSSDIVKAVVRTEFEILD